MLRDGSVTDAGPSPDAGFVPTPEAWAAVEGADGASYPTSAVHLVAPVLPGKLLCIGKNYRDHADEMGGELPAAPLVFAKLPSAVVGPDDPILLPPEEPSVDWEAELAVVIGRRARRVSRPEALDVVGGWTAFNDVSGRTAQRGDGQWTRAKGFDTFAPLGPCICGVGDLDPAATRVRSVVSGQPMQDGTTADLVFPVDELIAYVSSFCTLEPGDVIATGTPAGVGAGRTPPRFLRDGDVVEVTVEGVGTLRNPVLAEPAAP